MIISGKPIARSIYKKLVPRIRNLKERGIIPTLAIILVGNNPFSAAFVLQKKKKAEAIGVKVLVKRIKTDVSEKKLISLIKDYNQNSDIHGIVVQLPLPKHLAPEEIINTISPTKDVDGFLKDSPFKNPVSKALFYLLKKISHQPIKKFLTNKQIVIIGKGKTGGKPIYQELSKLTGKIIQIDSKTKDPDQIIKKADLVISCVGKRRIVNQKNVKKGAVLISVGIHQENGTFRGDYNEEEIKNIASFYTPTPGGIGPVDVACLLENVVISAEKRSLYTP